MGYSHCRASYRAHAHAQISMGMPATILADMALTMMATPHRHTQRHVVRVVRGVCGLPCADSIEERVGRSVLESREDVFRHNRAQACLGKHSAT